MEKENFKLVLNQYRKTMQYKLSNATWVVT
jgi:hypothetical protein